MTQGFKKFTLSMLSFSLLASLHAFAQTSKTVEIEALPPAEEIAESVESVESTEAPSETPKSVEQPAEKTTLVSKPVTVSPGMAPETVPPAQLQNTPAAPMSAAPSTPISVTAPSISGRTGNANAGGVQVQNITVQASPAVSSDQSASQSSSSDSRSEEIRRERLRSEILNEARLLERLEEGRLEDETERRKGVEKFDSSMAKAAADAQASASVSVAPVAAVGSSSATVEPVGGSPTVVVAAPVEKPSDAKFKISPFGGYRWFARNNPTDQNFNVSNQFLVGAQVTGQINDFLGIEGRFTYGRDNLNAGNGLGYYGGGGYAQSSGYYHGGGYYNGGYYNGGYYGGGYYSPSYYVIVPVKTRDSLQFDANARIGFKFGAFNPYGIAGVGFLHQKYNIDDKFTTDLATISGWERSTSHFMGNFGGGLDVDVGAGFSVGGRFEYNHVFNKSTSYMNELYGDSYNRLTLTGSVSLSF